MSTNTGFPDPRRRILPAIFLGGLGAGMGDGLYAIVVFGYRGATPVRIFQSIASGLLGRAAYDGGLPVAALGVLLHFVIGTGAAAVYVLASLRLPALVRRPWRWGPAFGVAVYLFMNYVVIPLSAIGRFPRFSLPNFLGEMAGHALLVGLPIALAARWFLSGSGTVRSTAVAAGVEKRGAALA